jgi:hypothetical protein
VLDEQTILVDKKISINLLKFIKSNRYVYTDTEIKKNTTFTYIVYIDNRNTKSSSGEERGLIALLG